MNVKSTFATGLLALALAAPALAQAHYKGMELAKNATVTIAQARATALGVEHGKIVDQELEKEKGGSGLRYSFDIKVGNKTHEVGIDAKTGKVLEDIVEGKNPD